MITQELYAGGTVWHSFQEKEEKAGYIAEQRLHETLSTALASQKFMQVKAWEGCVTCSLTAVPKAHVNSDTTLRHGTA